MGVKEIHKCSLKHSFVTTAALTDKKRQMIFFFPQAAEDTLVMNWLFGLPIICKNQHSGALTHSQIKHAIKHGEHYNTFVQKANYRTMCSSSHGFKT